MFNFVLAISYSKVITLQNLCGTILTRPTLTTVSQRQVSVERRKSITHTHIHIYLKLLSAK